MIRLTMFENVFFFSSIIIFLVFKVYSQTTPDESASKQGTQQRSRGIIFEYDDENFERPSYDYVQPNEFQPCDSSSYCTPIRRCGTLRHLWHKKRAGITCGPYGRVCCPKEEVPTDTLSPVVEEDYEASDDPLQPMFRTCNSTSYCIPIRQCSSLREGWNNRGVGITCGYGIGPHRMVCCPGGYGVEVTVRPTRRPTLTAPAPTPESENSKDCGVSQGIDWFQEHAIDDEDGMEATWPWMAALRFRNRSSGRIRHLCSGFLIDKTHVLTAAHCFASKWFDGNFTILVGSDELNLAEEYQISEFKIHEGYESGELFHDIGILTLAREVNISNFVPICLPDSLVAAMDLTGWRATVVGWENEKTDGPTSNTLKQLDDVPIVTNKECDDILKATAKSYNIQFPQGLTREMLCAGQTEAGRDTFGVDSGGPLMILYKNRWYAVGITSFGYQCGVPGVLGGYARITSYMDWIKQNTEKGSLSDPVNSATISLS